MKPVTMIAVTMKIATLNSFLPRKARKRPITMKTGPKTNLLSATNWIRALRVKMEQAWELV